MFDNDSCKSKGADLIINDIQVKVPNKTLIEKSELKIVYGRKYGLLGKNGTGKSTLLRHMSDRFFDFDKSIDVFYVTQEMDFDKDKSIYQIVADANRKKMKLLNRIQQLSLLVEDD